MNESKRNLNGALSVGARITLRDFPCRSSLFMEGNPLSSGEGQYMGGGHLNSNDNEYKTEISTGTDGKGIVSQSVFVPLLQVSPSTLHSLCHSI